jgi:hypothetical protein
MFIVQKEWMGGAIYGNVFASRGHFLDYALDFEARLAAAKAIKQGPGILVFCGSGFAWHKSHLEDFADFYHQGVHRGDDAFALMELEAIKRKRIKLLRNIDHLSTERGARARGVLLASPRTALHCASARRSIARLAIFSVFEICACGFRQHSNQRRGVIQKYYAAHIKDLLDTAVINVRQPRKRTQAQIGRTD